MAVTISDIARKVGKSSQLVSAVLNGGRSGSVASERTRERIFREARRLGYRPNAAARAVSTGRFTAVGLLLSTDSWKSSLPARTLEGIRDALLERDMHLSLSWFDDEKLTSEGQMPKILREMMADGLLVKYDSCVPARMVELLDGSPVPAVWLNSRRERDCVYPDDRGGGALATEFLLGLGHTNIGYADHNPRPPGDHYSSSDRMSGYADAMRAAGLAPRVLTGKTRVPAAERLPGVLRWLGREDRPTAVVAYGADDALPVVHAAALAGLRVPDELSVVTFAGRPPATLGVEITACLAPEEEMGREAVSMLLEKIGAPGRRLRARSLAYGFAEGATAAPPPS